MQLVLRNNRKISKPIFYIVIQFWSCQNKHEFSNDFKIRGLVKWSGYAIEMSNA